MSTSKISAQKANMEAPTDEGKSKSSVADPSESSAKDQSKGSTLKMNMRLVEEWTPDTNAVQNWTARFDGSVSRLRDLVRSK